MLMANPTCHILAQNYSDSKSMFNTLNVVPGQQSLKQFYTKDMAKLKVFQYFFVSQYWRFITDDFFELTHQAQMKTNKC